MHPYVHEGGRERAVKTSAWHIYVCVPSPPTTLRGCKREHVVKGVIEQWLIDKLRLILKQGGQKVEAIAS